MPQIIANYRNGSVEGLALPFLVSWLFGDLTNLIGCVLTHQLPFQTYLATYFVAVDVMLMSQYAYYSRKHPIPTPPPLSKSYPYAQAPTPRQSHIRSSTRASSRRRRTKSGNQTPRAKSISAGGADPLSRSWMSESSTTQSPASTRQDTQPLPSRQSSQSFHNSSSSASNSISTEPLSPTVPERGRTLTRPSRPAHPALETISGSPASGSPVSWTHVDFPGHGASGAEVVDERGKTHRHPNSTSRGRPPPPARRSSSMVFLSVGLLLTFGRWSGGMEPGTGAGRAWSVGREAGLEAPSGGESSWASIWESGSVWRHPTFFGSSLPFSSSRHRKRNVFPLLVSVLAPSAAPYASSSPPDLTASSIVETQATDKADADDPYEPEPWPKRDWERFIGRASAWLCTTLYLTSRLPQIWQNFRRRSVEGLSMLLFIMAFVGNSLYVLSILINPLLKTPGYLLESTPYLLGSGGTLCFDITIILQSVLYSNKRKAAQERARRRNTRYGVDVEEAAALLHADDSDVDETDDATTGRDTSTAGRRSRSVSLNRADGGRSSSGRKTISRKRSDSTELERTSRAERGVLEDNAFDFGGERGAAGPGKPTVSVSASRSRTRPTSVVSMGGLVIDEAGESSVTLRP